MLNPLKFATGKAGDTPRVIVYAGRGDWRKSPDVPGAAMADRRNLRIKSLDIWHVRYQ